MIELNDRHTTDILKTEVLHVLQQYNIDVNQIYNVTTYNERNLVKALICHRKIVVLIFCKKMKTEMKMKLKLKLKLKLKIKMNVKHLLNLWMLYNLTRLEQYVLQDITLYSAVIKVLRKHAVVQNVMVNPGNKYMQNVTYANRNVSTTNSTFYFLTDLRL